MNAFQHYGIEHLSAASINLFAAEPALWVLERLLKFKRGTNAVMARGNAVEAGVHQALMKPFLSVEACIKYAEREYDKLMAFVPDSKRDEEKKNIAGYVRHAADELRQYGIPTAYQDKITIMLEDVVVPFVGYIDWRFDQHGLIVDLKTSERLPSKISNSHGRQGTVYAKAHGNYGMRFAYAKPSASKSDGKGIAVYELTAEDKETHLNAIRQIARRIQRFLSLSHDPHELAGIVCPNYESFYWSNTETRAAGERAFGF